MKNYLKYCQTLKINIKKDKVHQITQLIIIEILAILFIISKHFMIGLTLIFTGGMLFLMHFINIEKNYLKHINSKEIAFYSLYRFLINMLDNQMILYNALKESYEFVDEILKEDVAQLIENIEIDTSIQPYIQFSNNFQNEQIKQMILLLYQAQESNHSIQILENMNQTILQIQDSSLQDMVIQECKKLDKFAIIPLILSATTIVLISLFMFKMIGGALHV